VGALRTASGVLRFGVFEVDLRTGELRRQGLRLKLPSQSFQVLKVLLEHPGELVSREELREKLWPADTFVDFDHGLNAAVNRLREALGDSADSPRFVETLPRRGYRLIVPVEWNSADSEQPSAEPSPEVQHVSGAPPVRRGYRFLAPVNLWLMAGGAVALFAALAVLNIGAAREKLLGKGTAPRIESIAVLPLENLSGDPEQEYLADGMTETLIAHLAKISRLRVISRTSVMGYKGTNKALPEIARELGADALIEGSVMRSGSRIRITAQLIYAPTDKHLWGESYERDLTDVLVLQSEVARAIAHEINIKLTPQDQTRLATARPVNSEAYQLYLKGRYYWNKMSGDAVTQAADYFSKAIALDGSYAPVYVGLADCYVSQVDLGNIPPSEAYGRARAATLRALEIDNGLAEAHASLAVIRADYDWDWEGAEIEFQRALELDPKHANTHRWHAVFLAKLGRFKEAFSEIEIAKELDPLSLPIATSAGSILRFARRYDEAIEELRRAIDLEPSFKFTHVELAEVYGLKGMFQEAASEWLRVNVLSGNPAPTLRYAAVRDAAGYQRSMQLYLERLRRERSRREYVSPMGMAVVYARLGRAEQALAWLEEAYRQRAPRLSALKVDPLFDFLRSNPRFQDLLRRMNFPVFEEPR
jgi:TolB-like protein/DNA-binding winged helix-turn-helix (wHTH) protein/Tfp pilus assembly protein PilF